MKPEQTVVSIFIDLPAYAINYVLGLVLAITSDVTLTSLALGSVFLSLATTWWIGLAVFFLSHVVIKMVNAVNGAIVKQGHLVANSGYQLAQVFTTQAEALPRPVQDPPTEV